MHVKGRKHSFVKVSASAGTCHGNFGPGSFGLKMDPPKLVPPGTNFSMNKDPLELILLQNMESL